MALDLQLEINKKTFNILIIHFHLIRVFMHWLVRMLLVKVQLCLL